MLSDVAVPPPHHTMALLEAHINKVTKLESCWFVGKFVLQVFISS